MHTPKVGCRNVQAHLKRTQEERKGAKKAESEQESKESTIRFGSKTNA